MPLYALHIGILTEVANRHGYALALHGSLKTDMDIILVPWADECSKAKDVIEAIKNESGSYTNASDPELKPHGRIAWTIPIANGWLDISVTPRQCPSIPLLNNAEKQTLVNLLMDVQAGNVSCQKAADVILENASIQAEERSDDRLK